MATTKQKIATAINALNAGTLTPTQAEFIKYIVQYEGGINASLTKPQRENLQAIYTQVAG